MYYTLKKNRQVNMSFFGKNQASLTPLLGFIGSKRENHGASVYLALSQL